MAITINQLIRVGSQVPQKKRTGFDRSELREKTHEKAYLSSIYDPNRDLIRAKPWRHIAKAEDFLASLLTEEEDA